MITVIVSIIAVLILIAVIAFMITLYIEAEHERDKQIRKVINDINILNSQVDQKQNMANSNIANVRNDVTSFKTTYTDDKNKNSMSISSQKGSFGNIDLPNFNASSTATTLDIKGTSQNNTMTINGTMWTRDGISTSVGSDNAFVPVIGYSNDTIYVDKSNRFTNGIDIGSKMRLRNGSSNWILQTEQNNNSLTMSVSGNNSNIYAFGEDGTFTVPKMSITGGKSQYNPDNLPTQFTSTTNNIRGNTLVSGDAAVMGNMLFDSTFDTPFGGKYGVGRFGSNNLRVFSASTVPSTVNISTAKTDGTFLDLITAQSDGNVRLANNKARVDPLGNMIADTSITAPKVSGTSTVCTGTECLNQDDVKKLRTVINSTYVTLTNGSANVSGNVIASGNICTGNLCLTPSDVQKIKALP